MVIKLTPDILLKELETEHYRPIKVPLTPIHEVIDVFKVLGYKHKSTELNNSGYFICTFVNSTEVVYYGSLFTGECFIDILENES